MPARRSGVRVEGGARRARARPRGVRHAGVPLRPPGRAQRADRGPDPPRSSAAWVERLNRVGVPSGEINRIDQVFADPQVRHLGLAQPVRSPDGGTTELVGQPMSLSDSPATLTRPAPGFGGTLVRCWRRPASRRTRSLRWRRRGCGRRRRRRDARRGSRMSDTTTGGGRVHAGPRRAVATVTVDNPERRNAVSLEMWQSLATHFADAGRRRRGPRRAWSAVRATGRSSPGPTSPASTRSGRTRRGRGLQPRGGRRLRGGGVVPSSHRGDDPRPLHRRRRERGRRLRPPRLRRVGPLRRHRGPARRRLRLRRRPPVGRRGGSGRRPRDAPDG